MERKFLEELGLNKETVEKIMGEYGKGIEKYKAAAESLEAVTKDRNSLKAQLEDVAGKLKAFEGVDLEALNKELGELKKDLDRKETEFNSQIAERDFAATLNTAILSAKGKNPKAITALLNTEALKASKNQKEDIAAAIKALAESDTYLFSSQQLETPIKTSTGGEHTEDGGSQTSTNAQMNASIRGNSKGE